ncbi:hypothetical protein HZA87_03735 [Candidatus Uhrbacteria bacterium]|nr:hypothetical protein [Candidatus Uhrbacteria bacterium]
MQVFKQPGLHEANGSGLALPQRPGIHRDIALLKQCVTALLRRQFALLHPPPSPTSPREDGEREDDEEEQSEDEDDEPSVPLIGAARARRELAKLLETSTKLQNYILRQLDAFIRSMHKNELDSDKIGVDGCKLIKVASAALRHEANSQRRLQSGDGRDIDEFYVVFAGVVECFLRECDVENVSELVWQIDEGEGEGLTAQPVPKKQKRKRGHVKMQSGVTTAPSETSS